MNKKEKNKLRDLSMDLLREESLKLKQERFKLKAQHATHQLTATHRLKAVRRSFATTLTIMGQKKI